MLDKDDFKFLLGLAIFFVAIITPTIIACNFYNQWQCSNFERVTGRETSYIFFDACYVRNNSGEFVRYDSNYKE